MASGRAQQNVAHDATASRTRLYTRDPNAPFMNEAGKAACRLPSGHPEAFFEAFANVYRSAYDNMILRATGQKFPTVDTIYPNVNDGVEGMYFIAAMRRQQREKRRVAAAAAQAGKEVSSPLPRGAKAGWPSSE